METRAQVLRVKGRGAAAALGGDLGKHCDGRDRPKNARPRVGMDAVVHLGGDLAAARSAIRAAKAIVSAARKGGAPAREIREIVFAGPRFDRLACVTDPAAEQERHERWGRAVVAWIEKTAPDVVIAGAWLHLDEAQPHLHAFVVPIAADGRLRWTGRKGAERSFLTAEQLEEALQLDTGEVRRANGTRYSARDVSKKVMSMIHDRLHTDVSAQFGLGRGEKGSTRQHREIDSRAATLERTLNDPASGYTPAEQLEAGRQAAELLIGHMERTDRAVAARKAALAEAREAERDADAAVAAAREAVERADDRLAAGLAQLQQAGAVLDADRAKLQADRVELETDRGGLDDRAEKIDTDRAALDAAKEKIAADRKAVDEAITRNNAVLRDVTAFEARTRDWAERLKQWAAKVESERAPTAREVSRVKDALDLERRKHAFTERQLVKAKQKADDATAAEKRTAQKLPEKWWEGYHSGHDQGYAKGVAAESARAAAAAADDPIAQQHAAALEARQAAGEVLGRAAMQPPLAAMTAERDTIARQLAAEKASSADAAAALQHALGELDAEKASRRTAEAAADRDIKALMSQRDRDISDVQKAEERAAARIQALKTERDTLMSDLTDLRRQFVEADRQRVSAQQFTTDLLKTWPKGAAPPPPPRSGQGNQVVAPERRKRGR